jgi:hypothetical protein
VKVLVLVRSPPMLSEPRFPVIETGPLTVPVAEKEASMPPTVSDPARSPVMAMGPLSPVVVSKPPIPAPAVKEARVPAMPSVPERAPPMRTAPVSPMPLPPGLSLPKGRWSPHR